MTYDVRLTSTAERFYRQLQDPTKSRVRARLNELRFPPQVETIKVRGREGVFRTRVGKYRILFLIDDELATVVVLTIDKRSRAYRE